MRLKSVEGAALKQYQVSGKGGAAIFGGFCWSTTILHFGIWWKTTFEVADAAVVEAEDAATARREIRSARPDVIVLDINMPGTTGVELCRVEGGTGDSRYPDRPLDGLGGRHQRSREEGRRRCIRAQAVQPARVLAGAERLAADCSAFLSERGRSTTTRGPGEGLSSTRAICGTCWKWSAVSASCCRAPICRPCRRSPARSSRRTRARARIPNASRATRRHSRTPSARRPSCTIRAPRTVPPHE